MPRKSKSKQKEIETAPASPQESPVDESTETIVAPETPTQAVTRVPTQVGPYEDRRKEMQRKLQKLVQTMRAQGASEFEIKSEVNREKRKEERKIIALEEKRANEEKACSNDVIIVPVAWKRNHSDKICVDATCDNLRRALHSTGLQPWLDCRREYSPGQKFAYWEHMGVKFRIEVGPDDVIAGVCRVVRADTPGAYLEHQRENPKLNLQAIIETLAKLGLDKCKTMNTSLMSSESLVEGPKEEFAPTAPGEDDWAGNAVIPDKKKQDGQHHKKLRRF